jgi:lysophospholipase L1-like esterase
VSAAVSGGGVAGAPLVALGDSITRGHGEPMLGVQAQSWAQWLAEALDVPFHGLAADGARVADVVADQVPRLRAGGGLGVLYAGVNDVRSLEWDAEAYARDLRIAVAALDAACDRLLLCTLPDDLGRPRSAPKPREASALVRAQAAEAGAVVVELTDLRGPALVLPDAVHPTALGQVVIAERAAWSLRAAGLTVPGSPLALADADRSARARARWRLRSARLLGQDLRRRAVEAAGLRRT